MMKKRILLLAATALVSFGLTTEALSQSSRPSRDRGPASKPAMEKKEVKKPEAKAEEMMQDAHDAAVDMYNQAPPAEVQEFLKSMSGTWEADGWMVMMPGSPPVKAKANDKAEMFGTWLVVEGKVVAEEDMPPMGNTFHSKAIMGWDVAKQQVQACWVDNMTPSMWISEGGMEDGKLVLKMTYDDPVSGMSFPHELIYDVTGEDSFTIDMFMMTPDDQKMQLMHWDYTRS